jgi:hydroxymethylpyrimidine pyrophosphatase-like HAD family hydrolase
MITVAFDVDDTLIKRGGEYPDVPRYDIINLFKMFQQLGCEMYIWSGGGVEYAKEWSRRLGLETAIITDKGIFKPDIAVDDQHCDLGVVNLYVGSKETDW